MSLDHILAEAYGSQGLNYEGDVAELEDIQESMRRVVRHGEWTTLSDDWEMLASMPLRLRGHLWAEFVDGGHQTLATTAHTS